jgi:hypothetical protein
MSRPIIMSGRSGEESVELLEQENSDSERLRLGRAIFDCTDCQEVMSMPAVRLRQVSKAKGASRKCSSVDLKERVTQGAGDEIWTLLRCFYMDV